VRLYRVFDWDGAALGDDPGGPLHVARARQGAGRHDAPGRYGAWYCSRTAMAAVAESIQMFRGQVLVDRDFERHGNTRKAIATLDADDRLRVIDLDDPVVLVERRLRPSHVATPRRDVTQRIALSLFEEGAAGLGWWSALNADWAHVTLFHERAFARVALSAPPERLTIRLGVVREAAALLGVRC
jgi:hypothetical protein